MDRSEMNTDLLFFGYYTKNTGYEGEFRALEYYYNSLKLPYEYVAVDNLGSWQRNTQFKSTVVADFISRYPGRRLCYVDVDSIVLSRPELLWTIDADIAAVIFAGNELLSGVVLFNANERTAACVKRWQEINAKYPDYLPNGRDAWDQRTLWMAIQETGVKFAELPPSYNFISDLGVQQYPDVKERVILATRGSVRFRKQIDDAGIPA